MCECGKSENFETCCQPYLTVSAWPKTAEDLMRSRYSAFATGDILYIQKTCMGPAAKGFNLHETQEWSKKSKWLGLQILKTEKGQEADDTGMVEFVAKYKHDNQVIEHHEVSQFKKDSSGHWKFYDGESHLHEEGKGHQHHQTPKQVVREEAKIGRNDPCHCGSGKKFKKCHGT